MYSYLYALIKKSEFGPIIARAKPPRMMLVTNNSTLFTYTLCFSLPQQTSGRARAVQLPTSHDMILIQTVY